MQKKTYEIPSIEFTVFETEDIMANSGDPQPDLGNDNDKRPVKP